MKCMSIILWIFVKIHNPDKCIWISVKIDFTISKCDILYNKYSLDWRISIYERVVVSAIDSINAN